MLLQRRALCLLFLALIGPHSVGAAPGAPRSILVKLRAEGPHAVTDCAEARSRRAEPLAPATADGSDSLDRLQRRLGVRAVRAVFRSSHPGEPEPFARQRQQLRDGLRAAAAARSPSLEELPDLAHVYRMELPPGADTRGAAARFRADPHVEWAQPNYRVEVDRLLDDPFLHSEGTWRQPYPDQWGVHAIDAPSAWDVSLGEGVVIAVVDTGVDLAHPDLVENLWVNPGETPNGRDDDGNGFVDDLHGYDFQDDDPDPQDENGHGTHVAGIAAARGDNGLGIAGVAPRATILPVRVFPPIGSAETDTVWRGVLYAAMNGADIVNGSFSCGTVCRSNPIAEEVLGFAAALGVAFVTSAGNAASDVMLKSPERLRESIVVGSIQPSGELASSSSFGFLVDVVAPGQDVLSLAASAAPEFWAPFRFVGDDYMRLSGTSMAAPHVSGVLALLLAADPALTAEDLRARIRASALDLGDPGHDRRFGAGLVRPAAALQETPLDARGVILSPLPGDTLDTDADEVPVVGSVEGADVAGFQLEIGAGSLPEVWTPLPGAPPPPFSAREIGVLPLAELPDGAYVLRLTITSRDGRQLREFTPIGVDRNRPVFLSSPDHEARNPDIHGRRVAWESPRTREGGDGDLDLFVGTFGEEGDEALVTGPGDQREVAVSRGQIAWLDGSPPDDVHVRTCRTRGRAPCRGLDVTQVPGVRFRPQLSPTHLVYWEFSGGESRLEGCRLAGDGGCEPRRIAPGTRFPTSPALDGSRMAWGAFPVGFLGELFLCSLAGGTERCAPTLIETDALAPEPRALDGSLLAYVDVGTGALRLCELGPDDEACLTERQLATGADAADLSRHRVVWDAEGSFGERDVYFCEYDPRTRRCPAQPVTRDPTRQASPRIDGTRLVWEDDRSGITRIASFELPALASLRDRLARPDQWIAVPLRTLDPSVPVRFSASLVGGGEIATLGGRLAQLGPSRALFLWRPGPDATGSHEIAFRASLRSGLYTEEVVRIEVRGPGRDR